MKSFFGKGLATVALGLSMIVAPQPVQAEISETVELVLHSGGAGEGNTQDYELTRKYSETPVTVHFQNPIILRVASVKVVANPGDSPKFTYRVFLKDGKLILGGTSTGQPGIIGLRVACITEGF